MNKTKFISEFAIVTLTNNNNLIETINKSKTPFVVHLNFHLQLCNEVNRIVLGRFRHLK